MGRSPCCEEKGLKKGPWTPEEDRKLVDYIQKHGHGSWRALPRDAGLKRCGKSCRLRWTNYLRPDIKRGKFSDAEEQIILDLHSVLGNKWSRIAAHLPGRTDNEIKNFWNTHLRKKLIHKGIDPKTHKPISDVNFPSDLCHLLSLTNLPNLTSPWDNAFRALQIDVTQLAKIQLLQNILQVINTSPPLPNMEEAKPFGFLNPIPTQLSSNELNMIHTPPNIANSWECLEGGLFNSEALALGVGHTLNGTYDTQTSTENSLPALSSSNQMQSNMNPTYHHTHSPTSTSSFFEAWDKLISDDEANFSWKDLID